jgi:nucleotide-binding universal stress UspA family protein
MRAILHPTDFSSASRPAFDAALDVARRSRAPLVVLHVLNPMLPVVTPASPPTYETLRASQREWADRQMQRLVRRARGGGVRATAVVMEGQEADLIARVARARHVGQIVMGTRGRTGLARMLLGSVAARVLAIAPCPVLTVSGRGAPGGSERRATRGRRSSRARRV